MSERTNSGRSLNEIWNVNAQHALYREDGKFYMPLERFPGAYFDCDGYIVFKTKEDFETCSLLRIGKRVNIEGGIKNIVGYVKVNQ